jgi:hypothetical protein
MILTLLLRGEDGSFAKINCGTTVYAQAAA